MRLLLKILNKAHDSSLILSTSIHSRMFKIRNITIVLALLTWAAYAQDSTRTETYHHAIGAGAGFTTGYGLSYRFKPCKFGAQVNFAPYHDSETDRYSVGLTLLYTLIQGKISHLYLYQGNHYYYNSEMVYVYDPNQPDGQGKERQKQDYFNNGLGFGIEFVMFKRVGFNLMGGYAFYKTFKQVNVTGETALYYKF